MLTFVVSFEIKKWLDNYKNKNDEIM